jgi:adenylate cyclase
MWKQLTTKLKIIWQSVLFWAIAMFLFGFFRMFGIGEADGFQIKSGYENIHLSNYLPLFALAGVLIGVLFAFIEILFGKLAARKFPLGLEFLLKTFLHFAAIVTISTFIIGLSGELFDIAKNNDRGWWRTDKGFWVFVVYIIVASVVYSFVKISNEKFGKGVFLKMLLGKYRKPQEEKRIFMFLDLKSSTTIAETLGHYKYSQLIQDCFYDINDVVSQFDAEIYQYVGDEVVLSWPYAKGLTNKNCVALFFEFQRLLITKAPYYQEKFGTIPEFKAGLHGGKLMVAEVGVVKKELAFHGDVINTSARIQAECNTHEVPILISEDLKHDLNFKDTYRTASMGNVLLKGKHSAIEIFTVMPI